MTKRVIGQAGGNVQSPQLLLLSSEIRVKDVETYITESPGEEHDL